MVPASPPRLLLATLLLAVLHARALALAAGNSSGIPALPTPEPLKDVNAVSLALGNALIKQGVFPCPCSPTGRRTTEAAREAVERIRKRLEELEKELKNNPGHIFNVPTASIKANLTKEFSNCAEENSFEACVNAAREAGGQIPICTFDSRSKKNLVQMDSVFDKFVSVAPCNTDQKYAQKAEARNEGCVAVDHLHGYVLQHREHLLRSVLCARGFCATRNHGIYVRGVYTSMGRMCAGGGWQCTEEVRLVNNLKIAANRRARVNHEITITPYDVRFPRAAIWAVQMLEDVWNVLALSVCTGTLAGIAILLLSKTERKE